MAVPVDQRCLAGFEDLCKRLNTDARTRVKAWNLWLCTQEHLCADDLVSLTPWYACCLYLASKSLLESGASQLAAMGVSMQGLLQATDLTPMEFYDNLEDFARRVVFASETPDAMLSAPSLTEPKPKVTSPSERIHQHASSMLRQLEVTTFMYSKFAALFDVLWPAAADAPAPDLIRHDPATSSARRRMRALSPSAKRMLIKEFTWSLFLLIKSGNPNVAGDLVISYSLLLCCLGFTYDNAHQDPAFRNDTFETAQPTLQALCCRFGMVRGSECPLNPQGESSGSWLDDELSLNRDVMVVNERVFRPYIARSVIDQVLHLDAKQLGAFDFTSEEDDRRHTFAYAPRDPKTPLDLNLRALTTVYESLVLENGLVDERSLLLTPSFISGSTGPGVALSPRTPLALYKRPRLSQPMGAVTLPTPVSHALNAISLLKNLVTASAANEPPSRLEALVISLLQQSSDGQQMLGTWKSITTNRLAAIQEKFMSALKATLPDSDDQIAFARFQLGVQFYYKVLESVLRTELLTAPQFMQCVPNLLLADIFHCSLAACALEVTRAGYQWTELAFPWILEALHLCPFEFQKVIEVVVRAEDGLSASAVKLLSRCENISLQSLVWSRSSSTLPCLLQSACLDSNYQSSLPTRAESHVPSPTLSLGSEATRFEGMYNWASLAAKGNVRGLSIFMRKVLNLARVRLYYLCERFVVPVAVRTRISSCLRFAIQSKHQELLYDRHLDLLMICCFHAVWRVACPGEKPLSFADLLRQYQKQPETDPAAFFNVPLAGGAHGNVVAFYNQIFLPVMESAIRSLGVGTATINQELRMAMPNPLPECKPTRQHAPRRVARTTALTVSKLTVPVGIDQTTIPEKKMSYAFHHSPSKNLCQINRRLNPAERSIASMGTSTPTAQRVLPFLQAGQLRTEEPAPKRMAGFARHISSGGLWGLSGTVRPISPPQAGPASSAYSEADHFPFIPGSEDDPDEEDGEEDEEDGEDDEADAEEMDDDF